MKKPSSIKIQVKGAEWTVNYLSKIKYHKKHGFDSQAITLPDVKVIDLSHEFMSTINIQHELLHAFVCESNTESANLDANQMEELCASIVGEYAVEIVRLTYYILNSFLP